MWLRTEWVDFIKHFLTSLYMYKTQVYKIKKKTLIHLAVKCSAKCLLICTIGHCLENESAFNIMWIEEKKSFLSNKQMKDSDQADKAETV